MARRQLRGISLSVPLGGSLAVLGPNGAGKCHIPDRRGVFPGLSVKENLLLRAPKGGVAEVVEKATSAFPRLGQRMEQLAGADSDYDDDTLSAAYAGQLGNGPDRHLAAPTMEVTTSA